MEHPTIPRTRVASSNIAALGFQDGILAVEFLSGDVLNYRGVPDTVYHKLREADSVGKAYYAYVRGQFPVDRVVATGETLGECPDCGDVGMALTKCLDCGAGTYTVAL